MIDGGNRTSIALLIDLRYHIAGLRPGTVVHLVATDPAAPIDLPAWCYLTGHTYLGPWKDQPGDPPTRCASALATAGPGRGGRGLRYDDNQPPRIPDQANTDGAGQPVT